LGLPTSEAQRQLPSRSCLSLRATLLNSAIPIMSAPQQGYPPQGYPPQQDPYGQQQPQQYGEQPAQPGFGAPVSPPPQDAGAPHDGGRKKKRGYAAQAYDFGAGANTNIAAAPPANTFIPAQTPAYGGYAAPEVQPAYGAPQPGYPNPAASPTTYGSSALAGMGGYAPPDAGYPSGGAAPGVGGITAGMGQMGLGGQAPQVQQPQAAARQGPLNQLYPTDLLNQPFNVAELDLPPPPIILPPNVSRFLIGLGLS
jgi:protein transport protein SEC24